MSFLSQESSYVSGPASKAVPQPATEPQLVALCQQADKLIAVIAEAHARLDQVRQRLLNPRPVDATKEPGLPPAASTVEGRLQDIVRKLDMAGGHLHSLASEFERAV